MEGVILLGMKTGLKGEITNVIGDQVSGPAGTGGLPSALCQPPPRPGISPPPWHQLSARGGPAPPPTGVWVCVSQMRALSIRREPIFHISVIF